MRKRKRPYQSFIEKAKYEIENADELLAERIETVKQFRQNKKDEDMNTYDLTNRIVWDYDKGRSITPERWNDPLDYEPDCENHYLLTRAVEFADEVFLYGKYLSNIEEALDPPQVLDGYLVGKIDKKDLQAFLDKKNVMWTPTYYSHVSQCHIFRTEQVRLTTVQMNLQEFYDRVTKEDF